jgi:uncharacterized protein YecE (DUF72 family)
VIRFGPAGWEYVDWGGIVYPKPEPRGFDRLRFLAGYYGTVEVNATFYRPFPAPIAARWLERVADVPGFRFGAKVWRRFTHERDEAYGAEEVEEARAALDALHRAGKLGAALLQFPWSFKRTDVNEEWLRGLFRAFAGLPLVLEVRHDSWDAPEVLAELAEAGVGFVNVDQPRFHRSLRPGAAVTSPVAYVRVHGRNWKDWFRKGAGAMRATTTCTRRASSSRGSSGSARSTPPPRTPTSTSSRPTTSRGRRRRTRRCSRRW